MAELSQGDRDIIKNHPLTNSVNSLQGVLQEAEKIYESRPLNSLDQLYQGATSGLLSALQGEDAAYSLRSRMSDGNVASDLAQLVERLQKAKGNFRYYEYRLLVCLVIQRPPDIELQSVEKWNIDIWKAIFNLIVTIPRTTPSASIPPSFDNTPVKSTSSSQKGSKQTLELVNPRIFEEIHDCKFQDVEGFFNKYFEGKDWSSKADAICQHVLASDSDDGNWAHIYYTTASKADLTGSKTEQQVDLLLRARVDELKKSKEEIRIKGTLLQMSRYVHEIFSAQLIWHSGIINIDTDSRQFFQVLVSYTMMSDKKLGLDIFIVRDEDKRQPEAELLKLAGQKNVQGVARIIGHSVITSIADMCCGLTFNNKQHDFKSAPPSTPSSFHQSQLLTEPCRLDLHQKSSSIKHRSPDKGMQTFKRSRSINQLSRDTQQEHEPINQLSQDTQQENELAFSIQSAHKPSLFDRDGEELYDNRVLHCLVISPARWLVNLQIQVTSGAAQGSS
ncbi:hypothetical protein BDDG_13615 [Blastomyces dermatitidis ATCC 18188]|uniref:Fungal-type protein kinase domain-containing protein n=1 Tax=Ajellomyces dermatitidis (strain ATCC 18188 / CBS 674.68) TaxID=653446 RepID=A0A0J9ETW3_AJEDA|nr:hypothetical protein BDDG_13615 [Blastomyces dermatitidis ATCC 18188]